MEEKKVLKVVKSGIFPAKNLDTDDQVYNQLKEQEIKY